MARVRSFFGSSGRSAAPCGAMAAAEPAPSAVLADCFEALGQPRTLGERWAALAKPMWIVTPPPPHCARVLRSSAISHVTADPPAVCNIR